MRPLAIAVLLTLSSSVAAQQRDIPIAPEVLEDVTRASHQDIATCADAERQLNQHVENLNAKLFRMETHPESGYDVRWRDRQAITSLILNELTPFFDNINRARFNGNSKNCLDNLTRAVRLANRIYGANLEYRRRSN